MLIESLKVGTKFGTEHVQYDVKVRIPENTAEMAELAKGSADFVVQMFARGWRIWNQEQSGARDFIKASTVADRKDSVKMTEAVQKIVDTADPTAPAKRTGRPARPAEVTVDQAAKEAMARGDMATLTALLAAQGIKLNIAE